MNVCAYGISKSIKIAHNDVELTGNVNLADRDEVKIGHYCIIFNNPEVVKPMNISDRTEVSGQTGVWKEWSNADNKPDLMTSWGGEAQNKGVTNKGIFGRSHDDSRGVDETIAIPADQVDEHIAGFDRHSSMRFMVEDEEPVQSGNLGNLDEKIIFFIGIMLLLGLIGLMMYWLLG